MTSGNVNGNFWTGMGHPPGGPEVIAPSRPQQERNFFLASSANSANNNIATPLNGGANPEKDFHNPGNSHTEKVAGVKRRASYDLFASAMEDDNTMEQSDSPSKFENQESIDIDATASAICQRIMNAPLTKRQRKLIEKLADATADVPLIVSETADERPAYQSNIPEPPSSEQALPNSVGADKARLEDEKKRLNTENLILKRGITLLHSKYLDALEKVQNAESTISRLEEELKLEKSARYALEVHIHALDGNLKNSFTSHNYYGEGY